MRRADRSGARYAVIIGDEELAAGKLGFKPLRADEPQQSLTVDELAQQLSSARKQRE